MPIRCEQRRSCPKWRKLALAHSRTGTEGVRTVLWCCDRLTCRKLRLAGPVRGLDIGCGANLIYPLLGAAANGWAFVAADVTPVAVEWARRNAAANPHLAPLLDVRHVGAADHAVPELHDQAATPAPESALQSEARMANGPHGQPGQQQPAAKERLRSSADGDGAIITPAVRDGETFAFTICNPPFFGSAAEAGLNPNTAHGGALSSAAQCVQFAVIIPSDAA